MQRHQPQPWDRAEIRNWMDTGIIGYDDYWRPNSNERMVLVYEMLTICSTASLHPADLFRAVRVLDSMMQKSGGFEEGPITWKIRAKAYAAVYASQKRLLSPKLTLKFLVKVLRFNTCDKSSMETPVPRLPGVEPCAVSDEVYGDPPDKDTIHRRAMHTLPMNGNDCLPADSDIAWHLQKEAVTAYDALMDTYRTPGYDREVVYGANQEDIQFEEQTPLYYKVCGMIAAARSICLNCKIRAWDDRCVAETGVNYQDIRSEALSMYNKRVKKQQYPVYIKCEEGKQTYNMNPSHVDVFMDIARKHTSIDRMQDDWTAHGVHWEGSSFYDVIYDLNWHGSWFDPPPPLPKPTKCDLVCFLFRRCNYNEANGATNYEGHCDYIPPESLHPGPIGVLTPLDEDHNGVPLDPENMAYYRRLFNKPDLKKDRIEHTVEIVFKSVLKSPQKLKTFFSKRHDDSENSEDHCQVGEGVRMVVQETTGPGCFAEPIFEGLDESDRDAGVTLETPQERADRRRDVAFDPHFRWCENYDLKDTLAMCQAVQLGNPYDSDSNCGHCANQDTNYPMLRLNILEVDAKEYWQREAEAKRGLHLDKMRLAAELEAQRESLRAREEAKVPPTIPPVRKESLPAEVHITCTEKVAGCGKSAFTCTARDEEGVVLHTFTFDY
ncbi:hypothetical protein CAPTEDRAFT_199335 [Capitella teleta]|uniref:Uncharacterized protein n=1 Tax=Capitella teleta TaxID=283909 RepID=R7U0U1_CAPTE|nr:hypothetical protein CAPTEDRAFT_199335 [Capitella teleta]|eukprot:ELT97276.1 hypothetical protein CAPTEDRAFT_199335 [Capitella teleta]